MRAAKRSMFTLVELMIVVIIVGILAASAVPLYSSLVSRAYEGEIVTALGSVRTAQRIYRAEHNKYTDDLDDLDWDKDDDLEDMQYVDDGDITLENPSDDSFEVRWTNDTLDEYDEDWIEMNQEGTIKRKSEDST